MKNIKFGDICQVTEGILVHGCNAQGVMGSGIAFDIRQRYPVAFDDYKKHLDSIRGNKLGTVAWSAQETWSDYNDLIIANCITQEHFGRDKKQYVDYEAVHKCFLEVARVAVKVPTEVHYPLIGAGLGGGEWSIISDIIDSIFDREEYSNIKRTLWIYKRTLLIQE